MLVTEKKKKKKKRKSHTHSKYGQHLWGKRRADINVSTIDFTVLILTYQAYKTATHYLCDLVVPDSNAGEMVNPLTATEAENFVEQQNGITRR